MYYVDVKKNLNFTLVYFADIANEDKMFLRVANDSCNKKKCSHIMRYNSRIEFKLSSSYKTFNKEDSILYCLKKINCDAYFYKYNKYDHNYDHNYDDVIVYLDLAELCYKNTLHLHSIPIKNINKFQSCIRQFNRFFIIIHPDHLHAINLNHI